MFKRYVAIGDSMTEGLFDPDGNGGNRGWADRLAEHLAGHDESFLYANLAVRGRRTHEIYDRQLPAALTLEPDLVSVVTGMNDLLRPSFELDRIMALIDSMLGRLAETGATVLTCTFGDPVPVNPYARVLRRRMDTLNGRIRETAEKRGAVLIDFARFDVVSDVRFWCEDRLHANSEGHRRIAAAAAEALGVTVPGPRWDEPLPPAARKKRREFLVGEVAWARRYLVPWVGRRFRNVSSGDGIEAKRPDLTPVTAKDH